MPNRVDRLREQGRRERGRPWLRWEDCLRRDTNKIMGVREWGELAEGQGEVEECRGQIDTIGPHPL